MQSFSYMHGICLLTDCNTTTRTSVVVVAKNAWLFGPNGIVLLVHVTNAYTRPPTSMSRVTVECYSLQNAITFPISPATGYFAEFNSSGGGGCSISVLEVNVSSKLSPHSHLCSRLYTCQLMACISSLVFLCCV